MQDLFGSSFALLVDVPNLPRHIFLFLCGNILQIRKHHQTFQCHYQVLLVVVERRIIVALEASLLSDLPLLLVLHNVFFLDLDLTCRLHSFRSCVKKGMFNVHRTLVQEIIDENGGFFI